MATLNWIGKEAVVNHDKEVPFKLLKKIKSASVGEQSENLIIHGDNLEALKALMPKYQGKVKCVYIDPPYNTGNEGWVYNDNVNSPQIQEWIRKTVGSEGEDLVRHDKWLCMIYPRLKLLKELMDDAGIIFVSLDDNEQANLRLVMDEIFGQRNFISTFVWHSSTGGGIRSKFVNKSHQYVTCYAKNLDLVDTFYAPLSDDAITQYRKEDAKGKYREKDFAWKNSSWGANQKYFIRCPDGEMVRPKDGYLYRFVQATFQDALANDMVVFKAARNSPLVNTEGRQAKWNIYIKKYLGDGTGAPASVIPRDLVGINNEGTSELNELFGEKLFENPKNVRLIEYLINLIPSKDAIILDSFAGSGTTAHAVMALNDKDGGHRRFILVEIGDHDKNIARDITAERVKRAIIKYGYNDGFEYCELDNPLFDERGQIDSSCNFEQLATYIYFTETSTNIDAKKIRGNYMGEYGDTDYYLLYKGKGKNDLDTDFLTKLEESGRKRVIYADRCLLDDDELARYNITFKQIPYEVKVY